MTTDAKGLVPCLMCAWGMSACEGPGVFQDLADQLVREPDEGYQRGGRKLLDGEFSELRLEPVPPSYGVALARDEDGALWVRDLNADQGCRVDGVLRYQPSVWDSLDFEDVRIPVVVSENDEPTLRFAQLDCELSRVSSARGVVVDRIPQHDRLGVKVETPDGNIVALSPWRETTKPLGRRILAREHPLAFNLLVLDGVLTLYDAVGAILLQMGNDVREAAVLSDANEVLYTEADGSVFAARVSEDGFELLRLADDACRPVASGSVALYFSPCAERRLNLYESETRRITTLGDGVFAPRIVTRSLELEEGIESEALAVVYFRDFDAESRTGTLVSERVEGEPRVLGENVLDGFMLPVFDPGDPERQVVALAFLANPDDESIDLAALDGEANTVLAERVLALLDTDPLLIIAEGSDDAGTLMLLESEPIPGVVLHEPELILSNALAGIEIRQQVVLPSAMAEGVSTFDLGLDTLALFRTDTASRHELHLLRLHRLDFSFGDPERLGERAGKGARFSSTDPDSVLALLDGNAASGYTLRQIWYDRDVANDIASRVVDFYESSIQARQGILYATTGDAAALWFTGLR